MEYIGREGIQRSLKRFLRRVAQREILATRYGFVARDRFGEMEGRGTGKSRENTRYGRDEVRSSAAYLQEGKESKGAGQTEGLPLRQITGPR